MSEALSKIILENERSDSRFESFCIALMSAHEGVTFMPTSQSWDYGRDARSSSRARGSHANVLCATLNERVDPKVEADLLRVTASANPDRLIYCSSQMLSEHAADAATLIIRRHIPNGSVLVVGSAQLAAIAENYADIFGKFYAAELQDIRSTIFQKHSEPSTTGLRLALLTFGSREGASLRDEVLYTTVLDRLDEGIPSSVAQICTSFSTAIGLPKVLPETYLVHALEQAGAAGDALKTPAGWLLSTSGATKRSALPIDGTQHLLEGQRIVREHLESLIGTRFSNQQYSQLWASLIDALGSMFHANGLETIKAVDEILSCEVATAQPLNLKRILEDGMKRVSSCIATEDMNAKVYQALLDMFTERSGAAFEWLIRVSERFVTICALGLETTSGEALRQVLVSQEVTLDSDIILSFLCSAEPDHKASRNLLTAWLNVGGRILVSPVVLEEVAHNAWISERDYQETQSLLGKLKDWELSRQIRSPFVRTFHSFKVPGRQWPVFIGQFRGNSAGDYSKILAVLRTRLKVELLPAVYDEGLKDEIIEFLRNLPRRYGSDAEQLEDVTYKVDRDGRLLASIAHVRIQAQLNGSEAPVVLLSSSGLLRAAEIAFRQSFGDAQVVLHKRAFSYLLSTIPQAGLGADTLRRALFDFGSHSRLRSHERKALRLIRATELYDMPWAERVTLKQELSKSIGAEATRRGTSRKRIQDEIVSGNAPDITAAIVVEAIQRLAVPSAVELELAAARKRIAQLELAPQSPLSPSEREPSRGRKRR